MSHNYRGFGPEFRLVNLARQLSIMASVRSWPFRLWPSTGGHRSSPFNRKDDPVPGSHKDLLLVLERYCLALVNAERGRLGPGNQLQWLEKAATAARRHSADMAHRHYFDHLTPEGLDVGRRLTGSLVRWKTCGENLFKRTAVRLPDRTVVEQAHHALMRSATHRHNVLDKRFKLLGVGIVYHGGDFILTQNFVR